MVVHSEVRFLRWVVAWVDTGERLRLENSLTLSRCACF